MTTSSPRPLFGRRSLIALAGVVPLFSACSSHDPFASSSLAPTGNANAAGGTIRVGSANFAESEIIGELWAQVLEAGGFTVERKMQIGSREVYLTALEDGSIDLIAEYTGNLLGYYNKQSTASTSDEVLAELRDVLPDTLTVLDQADAEDKDSYNVTAEFSAKHGITSLAQLADFDGKLRIGGPPELAGREYGPGLVGLSKTYGIPEDKMEFTPISDAGGPLTIRALAQGDVDMANIFSTTPAIKDNGFVTLEDPKHLITPQNVIPLMTKAKATDDVATAIAKVQQALATEDLLAMNGKNAGDAKMQPAEVAAAWLSQQGLV